jgi:hypothetical protein
MSPNGKHQSELDCHRDLHVNITRPTNFDSFRQHGACEREGGHVPISRNTHTPPSWILICAPGMLA